MSDACCNCYFNFDSGADLPQHTCPLLTPQRQKLQDAKAIDLYAMILYGHYSSINVPMDLCIDSKTAVFELTATLFY